MKPNPFTYGHPVPPEQLIGRDDELSKIVQRINTGQSTAITGSLRSGKTSILEYLRASEKQSELYADNTNQLIFYYLDASTLASTYNKVQFWDEALKPLQDDINTHKTSSERSHLSEAYQTCQEKQFGSYEFDKLIAEIRKVNWQLVLMIDEFDMLLHHPILNSEENRTEFFGSLRSRVSLSKGALTLVIASNIPVSQLNERTQGFTTGSPYCNFMRELVLGPLQDMEIDKLLQQGETDFTEEDYDFVKNIAGGHPYLLQVAASSLWEVYEKSYETDTLKRQQYAKQVFYDQVAENTLKEMWQRWPEETQNDFTSVLLTVLEQEKISLRQPIDINKLPEIKIKIIEQLISENKSLDKLRQYGFVAAEQSDHWRGFPNIFFEFVRVPEYRDKKTHDKNNIIAREEDAILDQLFTPRYLILMFMGIIIGERLGYLLTNTDFGVLSIFFGAETLSLDIIKFCSAILGGFLGYKLASSKMILKKKRLI